MLGVKCCIVKVRVCRNTGVYCFMLVRIAYSRRENQRDPRVSPNGWSWRFSPTPGKSTVTLIPVLVNKGAGPIPDSCRIFGEFRAPADKIISWVATALWREPSVVEEYCLRDVSKTSPTGLIGESTYLDSRCNRFSLCCVKIYLGDLMSSHHLQVGPG